MDYEERKEKERTANSALGTGDPVAKAGKNAKDTPADENATPEFEP